MICVVGAASGIIKEHSRDINRAEIIRIEALDDCALETDVSPRNSRNMGYQKIPAEDGKRIQKPGDSL
jgi:hypothetical protein